MTKGLDEYVSNNGYDVDIRLTTERVLTGRIIDETPLYYVLKNSRATRLVFKNQILYINTKLDSSLDV